MGSTREAIDPRIALSALLRSSRQPGIPIPERDGASLSPATLARLRSASANRLRPSVAIGALLAAMRAQFQLAPETALSLLAPALVETKDAVACADALFMPADAARDPRLLPTPMPSWCAHLVESGVLRLDGGPTLQAGRILQLAYLLSRLEPQREETTAFPFLFSARAAPQTRDVQLHLAISPPFASKAWLGAVLVRAAASRNDLALPIWLGPPASPAANPDDLSGASGAGGTTWKIEPAAAASRSPDAIARLDMRPQWLVLRLLEADEPQALWPLPALLDPRMALADDADPAREPLVSVRIGIDLGSTSIAIVEEDDARAPLGSKLLSPGSVPSGFRLLAGDTPSAHRYGCGESLRVRAGQLPAALCAASPEAIANVLRGDGFAEQLWLPQAGEGELAFEADRFKSPELLLHAEWLATVEGSGALPSLEEVSRKLLRSHAHLLGRTLACAHATPLATSEGGAFHLRAPRLDAAEVVLTHPFRAWSARAPERFRELLAATASELCKGLRCAWREATHALVSDLAAARASRDRAASYRSAAERPALDAHPVEMIADFGGLTLQLAVRVPAAPGRPRPLLSGTSMSYLLGGERCLSAAAFAVAGLSKGPGKAGIEVDAMSHLRAAYRASAKRTRAWTGSAASQDLASGEEAAAMRAALFGTVLPLLRRQLSGTLRRASPDLHGLRGAGVRLILLGDGWKLLALDAPEPQREQAMLARLREHLASTPLLLDAELLLERIDKHQLCIGALRAIGGNDDDELLPELQGIDTAAGQRFFGLAANAAEPRPSPSPDDPWWRELSRDASENLLRVEQWFGREAPFASRLAGGHRSFAPGQSLLRQWLDLSGPSLLALRMFDALRPGRQ